MRLRTLDREILGLAMPALGMGFVMTGHAWIDMAWVGRIDDGQGGRAALAALSIASFWVWIYLSIASLLSVGLTALVSRYVGAHRIPAARYVASQGLRGTLLLAVASAIVGYVVAPAAFEMAAARPQVAAFGVPYVRIYWGTGVFVLLLHAVTAVFRGHGNTRTPFLVSFASLAVNAAADPLLIFGWGPVPALGVAGSAWATALAHAGSAAVLLALLGRARLSSRTRPSDDEM